MLESPEPNSNSQGRTILLVSEPGVDGVFQYVRGLGTYLLDQGWTVHLAYSSRRDCAALHEFVAEVARRGGRTIDLRVGNSPAPADLTALLRLRALARETRPVVIHAHSSKAGVLGRALPFLGVRARFFYTPHAYFQMHGTNSAKKRFFSFIESVMGRVGTTICTSRSERRYAEETLGLPAARLCLAVTGVDCERFRPPASPEEKREVRQRFGLPEKMPLLGTVARLSQQKDPVTLYRGLTAAMNTDAGFGFAHLGKGELTAEVEGFFSTLPREIRERIFRISQSEDTPSFYRALDAFALPSRYEGFALSALEALATGLPMLLTDCPGNDDLKNYPFDAMRWSPVGDADALAANILNWAAAPVEPCNHRAVTISKLDKSEAWKGVISAYE